MPTTYDRIDLLEMKLRIAVEALRGLHQGTHYECDDRWYSCPKSQEGCADDREPGQCTCGADFTNERIDAALKAIDEARLP